MAVQPTTHVFLLGKDYHLGDLLWFTAVLAEYRRQRRPGQVVVGLPDRSISRILERNPLIDRLLYGKGGRLLSLVRSYAGQTATAEGAVVHDLRFVPIALSMIRQWRRRLPWLYYRDLWLEARGQWLASFLGLGRMHDYRPVLQLDDEDRRAARSLASPYVVLAPHIGRYTLPLVESLWSRLKAWPSERWTQLVDQLQREGYHTVTLAAVGQTPISGTTGLIGLPIRQVAGVIERAGVLITVESGLWFVAAALGTPFVITPWWLPRSIDWAAPMNVPHRLIYRGTDSVDDVMAQMRLLQVR